MNASLLRVALFSSATLTMTTEMHDAEDLVRVNEPAIESATSVVSTSFPSRPCRFRCCEGRIEKSAENAANEENATAALLRTFLAPAELFRCYTTTAQQQLVLLERREPLP